MNLSISEFRLARRSWFDCRYANAIINSCTIVPFLDDDPSYAGERKTDSVHAETTPVRVNISSGSTLFALQSRLRDKPIKLHVGCPQNNQSNYM